MIVLEKKESLVWQCQRHQIDDSLPSWMMSYVPFVMLTVEPKIKQKLWAHSANYFKRHDDVILVLKHVPSVIRMNLPHNKC